MYDKQVQLELISEGFDSGEDKGGACIFGQSDGVKDRLEDAADTLEKSGQGLAVAGIEVSWSVCQEWLCSSSADKSWEGASGALFICAKYTGGQSCKASGTPAVLPPMSKDGN